ncbi:MAG TPA: ATP-binding protein [Vicinamibacterales bacterium]|jgi:signal transduction histidine kinase|nr:ATP-binding protein [Vicinamibacterales bacterium]
MPGSLFSSLRGRIFLASALLAVLSIGLAIYLVNVRVTREAEATLQREMVATSALVDQLRTTRTQTFTQMARFIADAPKVKAAVDTNDPPTVQDIASDYQDQLRSNLLLVTNRSGAVLATVGASPQAALVVANQPAVRDALRGRESFSLLPQPDGMLQLVTVPISIGLAQPEILGTVSVGFLLDNALAIQLKEITGSDVAFGMDGRVLAATLPRDVYSQLGSRLRTSGISRLDLSGVDYLVLPRPLSAPASEGTLSEETPGGGAGPVALILRSRGELLSGLRTIHAGLAAIALVAVLLATLLSFAVARTITHPLAAITDVMREVAATGDLTRKIAVREPSRWDDEDARLLATTFNTLTESIARFQREMSQKERLTSLGRLSTVIAHEVRNPLMIIKASLHALGQSEAGDGARREAIADIDHEVARLNRIVNEVLDFSRPIRFDLAATDMGALCRESAAAAQASPGAEIAVDLDPALPGVVTDAERLRIALVNLLVNARHAVLNQPAGAEPLVTLKAAGDNERVIITIGDRGSGMAPRDLPQVFDPYFTTKRGGTGLGLPIAKNIVEGLGGTIAVSSTVGRGTEIRIELPARAAGVLGAA